MRALGAAIFDHLFQQAENKAVGALRLTPRCPQECVFHKSQRRIERGFQPLLLASLSGGEGSFKTQRFTE